MVFDRSGRVVAVDQMEHEQIFPRAGWVEHDADRDLEEHPRGRRRRARQGRPHATRHRRGRHHQPARDRPSCGTGRPASRSTTPSSGRTPAPRRSVDELGARRRRRPLQGRRPGCRWRPTSPGRRSRWILDNVDGARERAEAGELLFGTIDTWVLWNLTGGADDGGVHVTDVTNACRTLLMDLRTLDWDERHRRRDGHPAVDAARDPLVVRGLRRRASRGVLDGVPIAGILGDQQAATFGQACLDAGTAKNTYGTGNFMLLNTGDGDRCQSRTACSRRSATGSATSQPVYALEGSIAVTGSLVQWLRDNLGIITDATEIEDARRDASTTTAAPTSCRRSPACSPRTGARTPAVRSSASPASSTRATSRARRWRRPPSRPARWSRR